MIKKNNRQINRVIYADGDLPTPKPPTCNELRTDYCDKKFEGDVKEGQLKDAMVAYEKIFTEFLEKKLAYNKGRANWFNQGNLSPQARKYFKAHPDNTLGSIDDLIYLGDERRRKDQIRKKYPEPRTPADQKKLDAELTVINNELAAIFGNPAPYVPAGLIRELRDLKNQSNLVDVKADEKDKISKEKKKLDDELKKIKEDIEKKVPKCNIPKCPLK